MRRDHFLLLPAAPIVAACTRARSAQRKATFTPQPIELEVFEAINAQRERAGAAVLRWDHDLAAAARAHSEAMRDRSFFAHEDPKRGNLARRLQSAGITYRRSGENLFQLTGYEDPVGMAVLGWLESPGHRRNLMDRAFTRTGVGAAAAGDTRHFTQIFAA